MAKMTKLWHYEALCALEVLGYVFAGPIANQVLVSRWFCARRGRAMGFAYLGLGSGGVVAPLLVNYLIRTYGWRHALEIVALTLMAVVLPVGIWITRSTPEKSGLLPDGASSSDSTRSEEHTSELQSRLHLVCRLLLEKKKQTSTCLYKDRYAVLNRDHLHFFMVDVSRPSTPPTTITPPPRRLEMPHLPPSIYTTTGAT